MALALIGLASLFFLGHLLHWVFIKTKFPDILILVMIGFLIGPVFGLVSPAQLGEMGGLISVIALVVILYEGGLHLRARQLIRSALPAALISLAGFAMIFALGAVLVRYGAGQTWAIAILTGLAIGSTSSAIVIPMARYLSIKDDTKTILSLESAFTDVLAIVLFLVVAQSIASGSLSTQAVLIGLGPHTLVAATAGLFLGFLWAVLRKQMSFLTDYTFASEAWAILCYGLLEILGYNGAIGVLSLGFALANLDLLPKKVRKLIHPRSVSAQELLLLSQIGLLLRNFFFIYLGILIVFNDLNTILFALGLATMIFLTRYFATRMCFSPKQYTKQEAMVITAMGPRGLACAVLATIPLQMGIEGAEWLRNMIFALIPFSIILTTLFVISSEKAFLREKFRSFFYSYPDEAPEPAAPITDPSPPSTSPA